MRSDQRAISRRGVLFAGATACAASVLRPTSTGAAQTAPGFRYCLNTSTISGQKLPLAEQAEVAAKAGYNAIEPWIRDIESYAKSGGSLSDLKKRIADLGLSVEDGIGFANWLSDNVDDRRKGLEQAKRDMDLLAQIGGKRIAAPPVGATNQANFDLRAAAERYRALAEISEPFGIIPQLEIWGFSKTLSRIGEALYVAAESNYPKACILPDIFHIYKSGAPFSGLRVASAQAIQIIHMNDYPADPPREKAQDSHRIFPGDGVAPVIQILGDLARVNPNCILSLELFNREVWKLDALDAAKRGLEKMKTAVARID